MLTHNLGYPRIGSERELKKVSEQYWSGKTSRKNLLQVGKNIRKENWLLQKEAGIDLIPSNDFSFYDQVLDMSLMVGAIPKRYQSLLVNKLSYLDLYFAMARGYQKDSYDITAMEMTKWFDTNYHYIVPEFYKNQEFTLFSTKVIDEFYEAKEIGIQTKPVLIGPVSYLLLGKAKGESFETIDLVDKLIPVYIDLIKKLVSLGVEWIQFDEPFLALDLTKKEKEVYNQAYLKLKSSFPDLKIMIATYFESIQDNLELIANKLLIDAIHIDLVKCPEQLDSVLDSIPERIHLSLGVVDGRNIWKNNYQESLSYINRAKGKREENTILIAPSCSLLHSPCDLDLEANNEKLSLEVKDWLSFAKQKLKEVVTLKEITLLEKEDKVFEELEKNIISHANRSSSERIHNSEVDEKVKAISKQDIVRKNSFNLRKEVQHKNLNLPVFPTTTIGSFPQTKKVRSWRYQYKKGNISLMQYEEYIKEEIIKVIRWQEEIGLDVLVHGEFERNDMVEYFGEKLDGFTFTKFGWVQSYGSRCVKPPIIYGSVKRPNPMTIDWTLFAQSLTSKPVKGMLTGPVTILQWSFVRNDQPESITCNEIALAIRDEVKDLEDNGINIIQIDEPALREGLPLKSKYHSDYFEWAIQSFKIASSIVSNTTQIHTHMCYSEFNDIIDQIANLDADVITIECSRSQMELLDAFADYKYPNEIGPGVYDIHAPRVPHKDEIIELMHKAQKYLPVDQLWINPDCGLKTRGWEETEKALKTMVGAAKQLRKEALQAV
ncbi:5-methyltetrahydropteroyltriglutamate--homocysteine S-methyltransferase [Aquimarina sp. AD1]|uniref:5-methyltetrahydropteroyltriglutamate-- homocysteine S-methyltransferase n=1 Tax=Aquimarina sp. (strain AD1) TaxID=1714848 RepID=UPI000E516D09|nr:5-methyltetrahydropteroyltriglutamate--homocysteine S-methyltransferase [Aquimarina sp. AD1]AXT54844.1 5-methyltetrahydropteroyltriglutamate--homocysteine S-methyltransferase [Aquimarina sp. AD1]RKN16370.1 5-methyltetrahydropteroyltriglutamate--homocysteine S-methyltransferase [Aquimarina sp. AD1]